MTHYVVKEEILNHAFGAPGIGKVNYLPTQYEIPMTDDAREVMAARIANHKMEAVKSALEEAGY